MQKQLFQKRTTKLAFGIINCVRINDMNGTMSMGSLKPRMLMVPPGFKTEPSVIQPNTTHE